MKWALFILIIFMSRFGISQQTKYFIEKGIAIASYDAVSYFKGNPQKGNKSFSFEYDHVQWNFINKENLQKFKSNPQKYTPQYGGWCAYAMGIDGSKVKIDPDTYKIIEGKLYLFYNFNFTNTLKSWNKNESEYLKVADSNWTKLNSSN
jgi:YHS domain-containing protein